MTLKHPAPMLAAPPDLNSLEHDLLVVLACLKDPVRCDVLGLYASEAGIRPRQGLQSLLEGLVERGQVAVESEPTYPWQHQPGARLYRLADPEAVHQGTLEALQRGLLERFSYAGHLRTWTTVDWSNRLRWAVYLHHSDVVRSHYERSHRGEDSLLSTLFCPFRPEWYATLPEAIRVLGSTVRLRDHGWWRMQPVDDYVEFLQGRDNLTAHEELLLAEVAVARHGLAGLTRLLETAESLGDECEPWVLFLSGRGPEALERFDARLKAVRKQTGLRNVTVPGLGAFFHALCVLAHDPGRLSSFLKTYRRSDYAVMVEPLGEVAAAESPSGRERAERVLAGKLRRAARDPLDAEALPACLAWWWVQGEPIDQGLLDRLCEAARVAGYEWLEGEFGALRTPGETGRLVDCRRAQPPWEATLEALERLACDQPALPSTTRIGWRVGPHGELEGREQKLGKNGRWSSGRIVPLGKLAADSPEDAAILRCRTVDLYGRTVLRPEGWLELVGHPRVEYAPTGTPVEVQRWEVRLEVQRRVSGWLLKLVPPPPQDGTPLRVEASDVGVRVCVFQPQHLKMAELLARGLESPAR
ncbi:MAG: hypothetical protein AB1758_15060, partial [Candidatus Eremiobacterota bacterium]